MKLLKPLATSIFLGLNLAAAAGWHTNAPFVAWPATNHLRWVNGYTNAPHWTNSAYGGWTNNYWTTNLWTWINYAQENGNTPFYWDEYGENTPSITTRAFNAKDVRIVDCTLAALERWIVARRSTDDFGNTLLDPYSSASWEMFYRNETRSLYGIKRVVAAMAPDYYRMTTNGPTAWDTVALSVAAGGPSNFFHDPWWWGTREMTRGGGRYYPAILTNTWTLTTTDSGVVTNTFIDSWGDEHIFSGTNGQVFSAIVSNAVIQPGKTMDDYLSWDTLKAAITNLTMTKNTMTWTNNGIANTRLGVMPSSNVVLTVNEPYTPAMDLVEMSISNSVSSAIADYSGGLRLGTNYTDRPYQETLVQLLSVPPNSWSHYGSAKLTSLRNFGRTSVDPIVTPIRKALFASKIDWLGYDYTFNGSTFDSFGITGITQGAWFIITNASVVVATNGATLISTNSLPDAHNTLTIDYTLYRYDDQYVYWNYPEPDFENNRRGWKVTDEAALLEWDFEYR